MPRRPLGILWIVGAIPGQARAARMGTAVDRPLERLGIGCIPVIHTANSLHTLP